MVSLEFFIDIILPAAYDPGVDSASNRNEYQEYFLGGKGGCHRADNLTTFMCQLSRCSGSLKLLETSGPVQVCNGIALTFAHIWSWLWQHTLYLSVTECRLMHIDTHHNDVF
jgi:hypothetical protein